MGFPGLFKEVSGKPIKLSELKGKRVVVDGFNFAFNMASSLAVSVIIYNDYRKAVKQFRAFLEPLVRECSHVYLVWDGQLLPCKSITSITRMKERSALREQGKNLFKSNFKEAFRLLKKGFTMPRAIVQNLNIALNQIFKNKFDAFCAPYEADQQMAFMYHHDQIDYVLSTDSDMLIYNVPLVANYDQRTKAGTYYKPFILNKPPSFLIKQILHGCDYFPYGSGIQLRNNNKFSVRSPKCHKYGSPDRVIQTLVCSLLQFHFQAVFDISTQKVVHMNKMDQNILKLLEFLPNFVLGPTQIDLSQIGTVECIMRLKRQQVKQKQVQGVKFEEMYEIMINDNGDVEIGGLNVNVNVNSIYDDYMQKQEGEFKNRVLWEPKTYAQNVTVQYEKEIEEEDGEEDFLNIIVEDEHDEAIEEDGLEEDVTEQVPQTQEEIIITIDFD
ncbi:Exonuclease_family protein [Hexamita inflata]|uniref:Exonuclease family protein n=1 Tax=Hexamita inflata TaxID=28002 RepID=A0AA86TZI3_9EUKA|nr:Exonuclease family protein [Hexamita inflata]